MPDSPNKLSQFWQELKRRKVLRVITIYAAVAFVILQLVEILAPSLRLPDWTMNFILVLLIVGFIITVIVSWIYDIHPEGGVVRTEPTKKISGEQVTQSSTGWKIASYISFGVIVGLVVLNIISRDKHTLEDAVLDRSIAVLSFEDMSSQQDQEYFCDGMAEEIINSLTQLDSLKVIARTSTFAFKDKHEDIREIGRILDVSTVLEGSVQKVGNRLRITAQLINVADGSHLWSERYDRDMEDVFIIQDEISQAIVYNLKVKLFGNQHATAGQRQTENIEAYNLYLKGRFFWHRRTIEDLLKSEEHYRRATDLDSTYALAYAGLADVYFIMTWWGYYLPEEGYEKARAYVYKALSPNDKLPEAHATLGGILTWHDWDWKGTEKELKYAITLNPNDANAYQYYSELMKILGRNKEAREYINRAIELNPHSQIMYNLSSSYYYREEAYEKTIEEARKALEISKFGWPFRRLMHAYIKLGRYDDAKDQIKDIIAFDPSSNNLEMLDRIFEESGIEGLLLWFIEWLQENESLDFYYKINLNYWIAELYCITGDSQQALYYLEKSFEFRESSVADMKFNPNLELIRNEPGFEAMLKKMGM